MAKLPDKVEDWTAPWEAEGADEFDADKAKSLIFNARKGEEKAKDAVSAERTKVTELTTERDGLQKQVTAAEKGDSAEVTRLQGELNKRDERIVVLEKVERDGLTAEIALEKGLSPAQRKRLQGKDRDELEADADEILEVWGSTKTDDGDDDDERQRQREDEEHPLRGRPRSTTTPGDPKRGAPVERTREETLQEIGGGDFHY